MKKHLYLIRGVSGAGKTTVAENLFDIVYSADDYFMVCGEYRFNVNELGHAHRDCQGRTKTAMESERTNIAVTNTFTTTKEMKPYFKLAKKYGYKVFTLIVENRHGSKDVHNVPELVLEKQKARFNIEL